MRDKLCDSFRGQGRTALQNFEMPLNVLLTEQAKVKTVLRRGAHLAYAVLFATIVVIARDLLSLIPVGENFINGGFFTKDELVNAVLEEAGIDAYYENGAPMTSQIVDELIEIGFLQVNQNGELYSDYIREACDWPTLKELEKESQDETTVDAEEIPELF